MQSVRVDVQCHRLLQKCPWHTILYIFVSGRVMPASRPGDGSTEDPPVCHIMNLLSKQDDKDRCVWARNNGTIGKMIYELRSATMQIYTSADRLLDNLYTYAVCVFFFKRHQPREQSSLNPAWCEATYWWLTDNCPLTIDLWILKTLSYFIILPVAILPVKC